MVVKQIKKEKLIMDKQNPYRKALIDIIKSLGMEMNLQESNQVLILILMDSEKKIQELVNWIQSNMENGHLQATEIELMNQVSNIYNSL